MTDKKDRSQYLYSLFIKKVKPNISRTLLFASIVFFVLLVPYRNQESVPIGEIKGSQIIKEIELPEAPDYPISQTNELPPQISAQGVLIKDILSGAVIYAKNEKEIFSPASTTKIMTALVTLEEYDLQDVMTVKTVITEGRTMNLSSSEQLTVESLLYATLVHSANDAAFALAENYPGGVAGFVEKMNKKAKKLYLSNTNYANPIGFDDPNQYTSAEDLAKLTEVALRDDVFAKIVSTKSITVSDIYYSQFHPLTNVNRLLGQVIGMSGVKTGYTENAGEILVSEIKKYGHQVIFVVLKSEDRFGETVKLIDWVFGNFAWIPIQEIIPANQGV